MPVKSKAQVFFWILKVDKQRENSLPPPQPLPISSSVFYTQTLMRAINITLPNKNSSISEPAENVNHIWWQLELINIFIGVFHPLELKQK